MAKLGSGFEVNDRVYRSPRASHDISKLTSVSLRRTPLWLALPAAAGIWACVLAWWPYFWPEERAWLLGVSAVVALVASRVGVLRVDSIALSEPELGTSWGEWGRLTRVRAEIEAAIDKRPGRERV